MQVVVLPGWLMILSYVLVWTVFQIAAALIAKHMPDDKYNPLKHPYKTARWERGGQFYKDVLFVHKWKHLLPDGARVQRNAFPKKRFRRADADYLHQFIIETCRAELTHWLAILPFWVFGFWSPAYVVWIMLGYALIVNLPCIIVQRYNRPRLVNVLTIKQRGD